MHTYGGASDALCARTTLREFHWNVLVEDSP